MRLLGDFHGVGTCDKQNSVFQRMYCPCMFGFRMNYWDYFVSHTSHDSAYFVVRYSSKVLCLEASSQSRVQDLYPLSHRGYDAVRLFAFLSTEKMLVLRVFFYVLNCPAVKQNGHSVGTLLTF